jgi:hypothetical protein
MDLDEAREGGEFSDTTIKKNLPKFKSEEVSVHVTDTTIKVNNSSKNQA